VSLTHSNAFILYVKQTIFITKQTVQLIGPWLEHSEHGFCILNMEVTF